MGTDEFVFPEIQAPSYKFCSHLASPPPPLTRISTASRRPQKYFPPPIRSSLPPPFSLTLLIRIAEPREVLPPPSLGPVRVRGFFNLLLRSSRQLVSFFPSLTSGPGLFSFSPGRTGPSSVPLSGTTLPTKTVFLLFLFKLTRSGPPFFVPLSLFSPFFQAKKILLESLFCLLFSLVRSGSVFELLFPNRFLPLPGPVSFALKALSSAFAPGQSVFRLFFRFSSPLNPRILLYLAVAQGFPL